MSHVVCLGILLVIILMYHHGIVNYTTLQITAISGGPAEQEGQALSDFNTGVVSEYQAEH